MKTLACLALALAPIAGAGCATAPPTVVAPGTHAPTWQDTGTPPASVVTLEREVRYYTDEAGAVWDDRGRRLGARP